MKDIIYSTSTVFNLAKLQHTIVFDGSSCLAGGALGVGVVTVLWEIKDLPMDACSLGFLELREMTSRDASFL